MQSVFLSQSIDNSCRKLQSPISGLNTSCLTSFIKSLQFQSIYGLTRTSCCWIHPTLHFPLSPLSLSLPFCLCPSLYSLLFSDNDNDDVALSCLHADRICCVYCCCSQCTSFYIFGLFILIGKFAKTTISDFFAIAVGLCIIITLWEIFIELQSFTIAKQTNQKCALNKN